jgi:probable F420-dependent oxidoreductase
MDVGIELLFDGSPGNSITDAGGYAKALEDMGFASLWLPDHVVVFEQYAPNYGYSPDGLPPYGPRQGWFDPLFGLAAMAATTSRIRLGTNILILPERNPVVLAKEVVALDHLCGGRIDLGVGLGWSPEEFAALGVPFERRGARMVEWITLARALWTGRPPGRTSDFYQLPDGVLSLPTPAHPIPLLIGGHSPIALRRAGRVGDGWLAQQDADALDPGEIARCVAQVRAAGGDGGPPRVVLRIVQSLGRLDLVAAHLAALEAAGVGEVIVDVPVEGDAPARELAVLREAAAR